MSWHEPSRRRQLETARDSWACTKSEAYEKRFFTIPMETSAGCTMSFAPSSRFSHLPFRHTVNWHWYWKLLYDAREHSLLQRVDQFVVGDSLPASAARVCQKKENVIVAITLEASFVARFRPTIQSETERHSKRCLATHPRHVLISWYVILFFARLGRQSPKHPLKRLHLLIHSI